MNLTLFTNALARHSRSLCRLLCLCMCLASAASAAEFLSLTADQPTHVYRCGAPVKITVVVSNEVAPLTGRQLRCVYQADGAPGQVTTNTAGEGLLLLTLKAPAIPGWGLLSVHLLNDKGRETLKRSLGVLSEPEAIRPGAPDPDDFDAFWAAQIAAMNATPMEPLIQPVTNAAAGMRILDVRLSCGAPVPLFTNAPANYAYLYMGMPTDASPRSLPAIVQFQGASTIGLGAHPGRMWYADCAIHVRMSPHSARNNWTPEEDKEFRALLAGWGYALMNADSRENYYMRGMILRVVRTLQFVKQQPEWDGKVLFLHGESQGGFQSLVGAALDPDASFCLAMVPAMSDHLGFRLGRRNGWPNVIRNSEGGRPADAFGTAAARVLPYYDNANFARRIKCETWIATGLLDAVCPPSSVCAVFNALPSETQRDLYLDPKAGHGTCNPAVLPRLEALLGKQ
jgi:cephalosporin-C deacetylase